MSAPARQRKRGFQRNYKLISLEERGPNDPTDYEVAVKTLDAAALEAWILRWYRSRYVPEAELDRRGLKVYWDT